VQRQVHDAYGFAQVLQQPMDEVLGLKATTTAAAARCRNTGGIATTARS
jgi:hypothetical protein